MGRGRIVTDRHYRRVHKEVVGYGIGKIGLQILPDDKYYDLNVEIHLLL